MANTSEVNVLDGDVVEIPNHSVKDEGPSPDSSILLFVDLMEEQTLKKNRPTTTFSKQGWKNIEDEMRKKMGYPYKHDQIRNKFNTLRQTYKNFHWLITQSGINSYNPETGVVTADEDKWKKYCQVNKNVKQFKKKGCPYYFKLCTIYGDTTATGENVHPSTKAPPEDENVDETNPFYDTSMRDEEFQEIDADTNPLANSGKRVKKSSSSKSSRPRKENFGATISHVMTAFTESSERRADKIAQALSNLASTNAGSGQHYGDRAQETSSKLKEDDDLRDQCMSILNSIEGLDTASYTKAFKLLSDDADMRKMFVKVPTSRIKDLCLNL